MFDIFQKGNYTGSLKSMEEVAAAMEEILSEIGPEEFNRKRLTVVKSVHFRADREEGPGIFRTISKRTKEPREK